MPENSHPMFMVFQLLMLVDGFFMWSLIGQGVLALIIGNQRSDNFVYRFLAAITRPVIVATRAVTPRFIGDRHVGFVAAALLLIIRFPIYFFWYAHGWIPQGVAGTLAH